MAGLAVLAILATSARTRETLPAPELVPFNGKWHTDTYRLHGRTDKVRFTGMVHIFRNSQFIDSVTTAADTAFTVTVPLLAGENLLTAVLIDSGMVSPPSNTVTVKFDTGAGFYIPVPMTPGTSFDLNAVNMATGADVRLFDVGGEQVMHFESNDQRAYYTFLWDGFNQSGERVHRGPLVAVGTIDYPDGTHQVIRKVFLFNPEGSP